MEQQQQYENERPLHQPSKQQLHEQPQQLSLALSSSSSPPLPPPLPVRVVDCTPPRFVTRRKKKIYPSRKNTWKKTSTKKTREPKAASSSVASGFSETSTSTSRTGTTSSTVTSHGLLSTSSQSSSGNMTKNNKSSHPRAAKLKCSCCHRIVEARGFAKPQRERGDQAQCRSCVWRGMGLS